MIVDDPAHAFLERPAAKIHQQAERQVHQTQVCDDLLGVHGCQPLNRFDFDQ